MANILTRKGKKGTTYLLQWKEGGKRLTKSLGCIERQVADIALKEKELQLAKGIESVNVPKLKDYLTEYLETIVNEISPATYKRKVEIFAYHLIPWFGDLPLDKIKIKEGERYQQARKQTRRFPGDPNKPQMIAVATIKKEVDTLKALLMQAVRYEVITYNPLHGIRNLKSIDSSKVQFFSTEDMRKLYQQSDKRAHWWMLIVNTGIRVGEAKNLKWKHIGEKTLMVESTSCKGYGDRVERTKSGKWREVPITDNARLALQTFRQKQAQVLGYGADYEPDADDYVFPVATSQRITRLAMTDIRAAGLDGSAHKLRHTFCSQHMMSGTNTSVVQKLAGHSTIHTTNIYLHMDSDFIAKHNVNI